MAASPCKRSLHYPTWIGIHILDNIFTQADVLILTTTAPSLDVQFFYWIYFSHLTLKKMKKQKRHSYGKLSKLCFT